MPGAARLKPCRSNRVYETTSRAPGESDYGWLSKSDPFRAAEGGQETPVSLLHEACFIELDPDGIGRRTQRRVISRAWGGLDTLAARTQSRGDTYSSRPRLLHYGTGPQPPG
jgi:hypothetical protein